MFLLFLSEKFKDYKSDYHGNIKQYHVSHFSDISSPRQQ